MRSSSCFPAPGFSTLNISLVATLNAFSRRSRRRSAPGVLQNYVPSFGRGVFVFSEKFFKNPVDIFNGLLYDKDNKENEGELIMRYFRIDRANRSDKEILNAHSCDYNEDLGEYVELPGLAASRNPDGLDGCSRFGGAWDAYGDEDGEVLVLEGKLIKELYDGVVIKPTRVVARFSKGTWKKMIEDGTAWDWEEE